MGENLRETLLGGQSFSWRDEGDGVFSAVLNERVYRIRSIADASPDPFLRSDRNTAQSRSGKGHSRPGMPQTPSPSAQNTGKGIFPAAQHG